jgi:hypothetical protein
VNAPTPTSICKSTVTLPYFSMNPSKASTSIAGWIITIAAVGLTILLHYADVESFPVISECLDWITACMYHAAPALVHLPAGSDMWISPALIGAFVFIMAILIVGLVSPQAQPETWKINCAVGRENRRASEFSKHVACTAQVGQLSAYHRDDRRAYA